MFRDRDEPAPRRYFVRVQLPAALADRLVKMTADQIAIGQPNPRDRLVALLLTEALSHREQAAQEQR